MGIFEVKPSNTNTKYIAMQDPTLESLRLNRSHLQMVVSHMARELSLPKPVVVQDRAFMRFLANLLIFRDQLAVHGPEAKLATVADFMCPKDGKILEVVRRQISGTRSYECMHQPIAKLIDGDKIAISRLIKDEHINGPAVAGFFAVALSTNFFGFWRGAKPDLHIVPRIG